MNKERDKSMLEGISVEEDCDKCDGGYKRYNPNLNPNIFDEDCKYIKCSFCQGTGKITRPATLEDLPPWARIIEGLMIISDDSYLELMDRNELTKDHIKIAKSLLKTKTGRLRVE